MAGDWIKMRCDLPDDLEVIGMAAKLGLAEDEVVGKLFRTWVWIQSVSRDGHAPSVTAAWLDRRMSCDGWATAMESAGWLVIHADGLEFPNFDRHMSEGAKRRGLAQARKAKSRSVVTDVSRAKRDKSRDQSVTREEKRREETKRPPPSGGSGGDALPDGESDPVGSTRVTVVKTGAIRWNRGHGLTIAASVVADLGRAHDRGDIERQLIAWELWRQGEGDHRGSRNPMGSIQSWLENHPEAGSGPDGVAAPSKEIPTDEQIMAEIREVQAERGAA